MLSVNKCHKTFVKDLKEEIIDKSKEKKLFFKVSMR